LESFFIALASASLFVTWVSSTHLVSLQGTCRGGEQYATVAMQNGATLQTASLAPFGRPEQGWRIYEPQVAATIGTTCAGDTKRFAASVAKWQSRNRLRVTGAVDTQTISVMKRQWQDARPFIQRFASGTCPAAAHDHDLAAIGRKEGWLGKEGQLDARALDALRRMVAAARAADPRIKADPHLLTIVSAYRSPDYDAARCAAGANCNGIAKARCSAHRTGTAVDLFVGAAPGHSPVDSADANRLYQSRTPTYRWLVKNAARFGFVNYVFEPWHWEWVGEPSASPHMNASKSPAAKRS
jgi:D-alanyl-D-alanine carboxypeptidase